MRNLIVIAFAILFGAVSIGCNKKVADTVAAVPTEVISWRASAPKSAPAKPISMGEFTETSLDNGLKLIIVENHKLPLVNFQISVDSPPILEENGGIDKTGYVGLAGTLMSTGTSTLSKSEIDQKVDNIGARLNTSGRSASGQCLTKHMDSFLEVFSDVLINPSFEQSEFEKAVKRSISGIQSNQDDPNIIARTVRNKLVFGTNHPFGLSESIKSVNNVELADVKAYYESTFYPQNTYLIIVGDITPEEAKLKAEQYFGKWKNPLAYPSYAPMPVCKKPAETSVSFVNKPGAVQSVINITYPIDLKPGETDAIKASLMNAILGGGVFSSKLMQNLREDKAFTYGARSSLSNDPYQGDFNAFASVRNEVTDSSVVEFLKEMKEMRSGNFTDENLDIAKKFMIGTFSRSLTNPRTVARMALATSKYNLPADYYKNYTETIQNVTKEDIVMMADKYITPENAHIVVVGNKSDVAQKLLDFDKDKTIDFYDTQGNYLEPVEEKLPDGHTAEIVISDYFDALGGRSKIEAIDNFVSAYGGDIMGQASTVLMIQQLPNMFMQEITSGKMTMQKQVFDGKTLAVSTMQGNQNLTEGPEFERAKLQGRPFSRIMYSSPGYSMTLKGIEKLEGVPHYMIEVVKPTGDKALEYFSTSTNLLSQMVETVEAQGQTRTMTTKYSDYQEVDGVKLPGVMELIGVLPVPLVLTLKDAKINAGVDAATFEIK